MSDILENIKIRHDTKREVFDIVHKNGNKSYLDYEQLDDNMLDYKMTYVPEEYRNAGVAGSLVEHALEYARDNNYKVKPSCPFVQDYINRNKQFKDIVAGN